MKLLFLTAAILPALALAACGEGADKVAKTIDAGAQIEAPAGPAATRALSSLDICADPVG